MRVGVPARPALDRSSQNVFTPMRCAITSWTVQPSQPARRLPVVVAQRGEHRLHASALAYHGHELIVGRAVDCDGGGPS